MKLLIVSHTPHYLKDRKFVGWGPTVKEIDQLAGVFDAIVHIGFLYCKNNAPLSSLAYEAANVKFIGVPPAGGKTITAKFNILLRIPLWIKTIFRELRQCDIIHIRCPANISFIALLMLVFLKYPKKRWVKYAGDWNQKKAPLSFYFQRWLLHHNFHRGVVTINGKWKKQKKHEISFLNPSLSEEEINNLMKVVENKTLKPPIKILFTGRLEKAKGPQHVIEASSVLVKKGYNIFLTLIGDGEDRKNLEFMTGKLDIIDNIHFCGWLPHREVKEYLLKSHFLILPSASSEGWPKVLSEAFAYGVFCIASNISSIPQILVDGRLGKILKENSGTEIAEAIGNVLNNPDNWRKIIQGAYNASREFTYKEYIKRIKEEIIAESA